MRAVLTVIAIGLILPSTGCAAILGLDSGKDSLDDAGADGSEPNVGDGAVDGGAAKDAGPPPPVCAPNTADCNGNPADGCETSLSSPQHCGGCATACTIAQSCSASHCCTNDNLICSVNEDCCSQKCNGHKCGH